MHSVSFAPWEETFLCFKLPQLTFINRIIISQIMDICIIYKDVIPLLGQQME